MWPTSQRTKERAELLDFLRRSVVHNSSTLALVVDDINAVQSPQTLAAHWLLDLDTLRVGWDEDSQSGEGNDRGESRVAQRFVLALLYFSTQSSEVLSSVLLSPSSSWSACGAIDFIELDELESLYCDVDFKANDVVPKTGNSGTGSSGGTKRFLTPFHECEWFGVTCNSDNVVTSIQLGE